MKVLILAEDGFQEQEYWPELYYFEAMGWNVDTATPNGGPRTGKNGIPIKKVDLNFEDLITYLTSPTHTILNNLEKYDILYLMGGVENAERLRVNPVVKDIVKYFNKEGKLICSICHGAMILISADIIENRKCTGYDFIKDDIINAGAIYPEERVVVDGNLITARHYSDTGAFLRAINRYVCEGRCSGGPPQIIGPEEASRCFGVINKV